jgi:WD40 repeat protein
MIYVWKASTGEKLLQIGPTIDGISAIALSPDSAVISAVVGRSLVSWDAINGVMQSQVPFPLRSVSSMEFNADGTKLVFGSFSGLVWVWDVASQKNTLEYTGHRSFGVLAVSFSPDGQRIASGGFDSLVRIWNAENGSDVAVSSRDVHDERIHDVEFSRDGKMVGSVSGDRTLRIWDSSNGAIIDVIKGHASYVWSLSFHPDGRSVATASADGTAKIWNIPVYKVGFSSKGSSLRRHNRECLWVKGINGVRTVALNKEGTILAYNLNHQIVLWDLVNDRELSKLSGHSNGVTSILFFDNDRKIATSSMDNSVKIWDVAKERPILSLDSHTDPNVVLAINYQSRRIATASGKDIRLWDITNGELISKFVGQTDNTGCLAFSPNGLQLASSASNGWIKIWDANTHNEIFFFNSRHQGSSLKISYNSQGNLFAMAGTDGLHLWDSVTWKKQRVLKGHSSQINCFNFFADGKRLLTGSQDKSIKVWNVDNGNQLLTLLQIKGIDTVGVVDVSVSENGNRIATSTRYEIKIFGAAKPIAVSN